MGKEDTTMFAPVRTSLRVADARDALAKAVFALFAVLAVHGEPLKSFATELNIIERKRSNFVCRGAAAMCDAI